MSDYDNPYPEIDNEVKRDEAAGSAGAAVRDMLRQLADDDSAEMVSCICVGITESGHLATMYHGMNNQAELVGVLELGKQKFMGMHS